MKSFNQFIVEGKVAPITEAAMTATGAKAEDHISKYLQPDQLKTLKYKLAKDTGGGKAGEEVKVNKVVPTTTMDGSVKYHAHITHSNGKAVVPLNHVMKPEGVGRAGKGSEGKEDAAVDNLHKSIQAAAKSAGAGSVKIKHMGKTYSIAGARKVVSGDFSGRKPKGDIILHDEQGKPQIFLSHKAGAAATQAQNYEGLSGHTENPQVAKFTQDLQKQFPKGLQSGHSFVRKFTTNNKRDKDLHKAAMFGSDHASDVRSVHNVHSIAHGAVGLQPAGRGHFELTSDKFIHHDENFKHSDHPIEFTARYMKDRKDNGVMNARIGIAKVGSRPSSKEF